jgi:hypothetical protein
MKMKNLFLAVLAALTLASPALAQTQWKNVPLTFVRVGNPSRFSFSGQSGSGAQTSFLANVKLDGTYPNVNAYQDTTGPIPIHDHFSRRAAALRAAAGGVLGSVGTGDTSSVFGVLSLRSTSSAIDTIKVLKDVSLDGLNWLATDSLSASVYTNSGTITVQPIAGDSCSVKLAAITDINGGTSGAGSILFYCNPFAMTSNVTRVALVDVLYVRFRIQLTAADSNAASTNGGVTGTFSYPIAQSNFNP